MQLERYVKKHIVPIGTARVRRSGDIYMTARQEYLLKAAELSAMAQVETVHADRLEFENLARSYLRLAKQAERNAKADLAYRTSLKGSRSSLGNKPQATAPGLTKERPMRPSAALLFVIFISTPGGGSAAIARQPNRDCRSLGHRNQLQDRQV